MISEVITIIKGIGVPFTFVVILFCMVMIAKHGDTVMVFVGKCQRTIGFISKWIRKDSVANTLQGNINSLASEFNKQFVSPLLPKCKIKWVDKKNIDSVFDKDESIICLCYDELNQNKNFVNATYSYVKTTLIPKVKLYIEQHTCNAFDLITTHAFVKQIKREALTEFNSQLSDFAIETKSEFDRFYPTQERGLFNSILISELFHIGELINELPYKIFYQAEIKRFIDWFYQLATREWDENTDLRFESKLFKIGIILVAKQETWDTKGKEAYIRWGAKYAADGYNAVYVVSKGADRDTKSNIVANELKAKYGFEQINTRSRIDCIDENGKTYFITCISLRPNNANLAFNAWETIKDHFDGQMPVTGIVSEVAIDKIIVNVYGLKFDILADKLSAIKGIDPRKFFRRNQELMLMVDNFVYFDRADFSNINTETDPKIIIDEFSTNLDPVSLQIKNFRKDKEGFIQGLGAVKSQDSSVEVFIPRSKATYSKYTALDTKYSIGQTINVKVKEFAPKDKSLVGEVIDMVDPWGKEGAIQSIQEGIIIDAPIKELSENEIKGELFEGVDYVIHKREISFNPQECSTSSFNIGDVITLYITTIDHERRRVFASIRKVRVSEEHKIFLQSKNEVCNCIIKEIHDRTSLIISIDKYRMDGIIPISETCWGNPYPLSRNFHEGDVVEAVAIRFDDDKNIPVLSMRRVYSSYPNDVSFITPNEIVSGRIVKIFTSFAEVEIELDEKVVIGYIELWKLSNMIKTNEDMIGNYLQIGDNFSFIVDYINFKNNTVCLSRQKYFSVCHSPEYGNVITAKIVKINGVKIWFYANNIEGYIIDKVKKYKIGDSINVILASKRNDFEIVT